MFSIQIWKDAKCIVFILYLCPSKGAADACKMAYIAFHELSDFGIPDLNARRDSQAERVACILASVIGRPKWLVKHETVKSGAMEY
jgi:hypothetical protein